MPLASPTGRRLTGVVLVFVSAVLFALLARIETTALLSLRAEQTAAVWDSGRTPFDIDFRDPAAIIVAGSNGLAASRWDASGILLTASEPTIGLALRPRTARVPLEQLSGVTLAATSTEPVEWTLLAYMEQRFGPARVIATGTLRAESNTGSNLTGSSVSSTSTRASGMATHLQLRLTGAQDFSIRLQSLRFATATDRAEPDHCDGGDSQSAQPLCPSKDHRIAVPAIRWSESQLHWIDEAGTQHPGAAFVPANPSAIASGWLRWSTQAPGYWLVLALTGLLGAGALWLSFRTVASHRALARGGSLLLLAYLLMLLSGHPTEPLTAAFPWIALGLLLVALWTSRRSEPLRWFGGSAAWSASAAMTLTALLALVVFGDIPASGVDWPSITQASRYLAWAALQQWLLQRLIVPAWRSRSDDHLLVALASGLTFGVLHFPNTGLMLFSALGAFGWALLGQRYRSLLPLIVSHWLLGLSALMLLSPEVLRNAEIGSRFLMPR